MKNKLMIFLTGMLIASIPVLAQENADSLAVVSSKKFIAAFKRLQQEGEVAQQRQDSIDKVAKERCKPGTPMFNFQYQDVDGHAVSLKDLKGKYVFIDVWATWCGPCCAEIPYLQKLEKLFSKKKIVFVSISVDNNTGTWKRMVKEKQLGGIQLNYGGNSRLLDEFGITGIPRFILLDKKGRIVNARMTRPSDEATEKTLSGLKGI